ncbi:MAG: AraC family transcriptional regulator, partial [Cytophagaceae bacterium]|nr:AraC family transcriptional regulator [Cytophagaceae bacterium]
MVMLPPKIDLFALLIFLGIVQGPLLAYFFLRHSRGAQFANRFLGWLLLGLSLLMADVWLCYTNYMFRVVWLDDVTEPINLLISPLVYLYFQTSLSGRFQRRQWLHFLPAGLYFVYLCLIFYPQPEAFKYNFYISAFHNNLPDLPVQYYGPAWAFWLKDQIIEMTLVSMGIYLTLSLSQLAKAFRQQGLTFFSNQNPNLAWYRRLALQLCSIVVVFLVCRLYFPDDLGDHLIAAHMAFVVYATSFSVLRQSAIFQNKPISALPSDDDGLPVRKYEKSSLTPELQEAT